MAVGPSARSQYVTCGRRHILRAPEKGWCLQHIFALWAQAKDVWGAVAWWSQVLQKEKDAWRTKLNLLRLTLACSLRTAAKSSTNFGFSATCVIAKSSLGRLGVRLRR